MDALMVGQEIRIGSGVYGCKGKVVNVAHDCVEVLVEAVKVDERYLRSISTLSPEIQKELIADMNFAGNAKIAEDSLNHPLIMFTLDALVCGRHQRFCADEICLKPTTEKFLHIEQVPYILVNRPFPRVCGSIAPCESP